MGDSSDPPRKHYQLKPKEFVRVNPPSPSASPAELPPPAAPSASPPPARGADDPIDVRRLAQIAAQGSPVPGSPSSPAPAAAALNDVQAMLRENHQRLDAAGAHELAPQPRRRSRRWRDYWIVLLPVDGFLAFWAFGPYANASTFVYGLGGMAFFTVGFTWVMFGIVEDY